MHNSWAQSSIKCIRTKLSSCASCVLPSDHCNADILTSNIFAFPWATARLRSPTSLKFKLSSEVTLIEVASCVQSAYSIIYASEAKYKLRFAISQQQHSSAHISFLSKTAGADHAFLRRGPGRGQYARIHPATFLAKRYLQNQSNILFYKLLLYFIIIIIIIIILLLYYYNVYYPKPSTLYIYIY